MKSGVERAPHRALFRATGLKKRDFSKPFIGVCNSYSAVVPGHCHLNKVGKYICDEIRKAGGVPFEFNTIAICDGIAMGHQGMKFSQPRTHCGLCGIHGDGASVRRHDLHSKLR